ncbi:flavin monoamine oxidase family protein [Flammeovirga agarivorans]|uniref:Tryptophan 2-monooxygenase n=1 Tax=Flammeovirga agarivorans TaxID=2726742 RepID=A0A7X8XU04_9BACT|nr:NAD(P)/FAD-dependent oxidoreductase [Flammeovirga agarivorans]NLR89912.1 FAD-dependent oxidoreductase [Flammeovirga agarivorans]
MNIAIIGGGISGLYTASILKELNYNITVYEASDRLGGRIYTHSRIKKKFVELGAAEIHGMKSVNYEMLDHLEHKIEPIVGNEYVWFENKLHDVEKKEDFPESVNGLFAYFGNISNETYEGSVMASLKEKSLYSSKLRYIVDGITSEYSASAEKLYAKSLGEEEWRWSSGFRNFFSYGRYSDAIDFFKDKLENEIQLNTSIVDINYADDGVTLLTRGGESHHFDKVIVSTSLGVLKKEKINFTPPMPDEKRIAIQKLGFGKGRKLFIEFDKPFWEEDTTEILGGKKCPIYLIRPAQPNCICAYIMADAAKEFNQLSDEDVAEILINELDEMFPDLNVQALYSNHYGKDWTSDPYFHGTYSYSRKDSIIHRETLKQPIEDKVFFIGEACNTSGHSATVHGAMETGEEVVRKYFDSKVV